jgi:hypothetical protein
MTPQELKQFIIEHKYFPGWEIAMFLKRLYPDYIKGKIVRGGDGVLLPGGCELARTRSGKWLIKSYSEHDMDIVCEELSQFNSIGTGCNIVPQDMCGTEPTLYVGRGRGFYRERKSVITE